MIEEIINARIASTHLGPEDRGIFTCYLGLEWQGCGQSFGGYGLDKWHEDGKRRIGTAYGLEFLKRILAAVGVSRWEDLPGKYVRIKSIDDKIVSLGHIIEDRWFKPADLIREMP